jgi:phosphatidylinositol alpha-mannosyltransferase
VLEAVQPADVVHVHEPFVPVVSLAVLRDCDKPIVGTFHADPGAGVRLLYRAARRQLHGWASRLTRATAVSSVAAQGAAGLVDDVTIIPNGIDVARYRETEDATDAASVLFLGRDEPRKGLDVLLNAWPSVIERVPGARLTVAGSQRKGDHPNVRFLGPVSENRKRQELRSASILVAPNTGGESFGIVLVEGMAAGCALVASSLPAFHEVAGDAAIYVRPKDPSAVARALITLLLDEEVRTEQQLRGSQRADAFDGRRVAADYLKVYVEAVESASS